MFCIYDNLRQIDKILSKLNYTDIYKIKIGKEVKEHFDTYSSLEALSKEEKYTEIAIKHIARIEKERKEWYEKIYKF